MKVMGFPGGVVMCDLCNGVVEKYLLLSKPNRKKGIKMYSCQELL
jgi:hypothetical protein